MFCKDCWRSNTSFYYHDQVTDIRLKRLEIWLYCLMIKTKEHFFFQTSKRRISRKIGKILLFKLTILIPIISFKTRLIFRVLLHSFFLSFLQNNSFLGFQFHVDFKRIFFSYSLLSTEKLKELSHEVSSSCMRLLNISIRMH